MPKLSEGICDGFSLRKVYAEVAKPPELRDHGRTHGTTETSACTDRGAGTHLPRAEARARCRASRYFVRVAGQPGGSPDGRGSSVARTSASIRSAQAARASVAAAGRRRPSAPGESPGALIRRAG